MSDKYIPKVGDEFEWSYKGAASWTRAKANCVTDKAIGYEDSKGWIVTVCKSCNFRPIPTKADVEREKLVEIIKMFSDLRPESIAKEIQKANFTIPKKVKQSELLDCVAGFYTEDLSTSHYLFTNELCDLLGDLVESDL